MASSAAMPPNDGAVADAGGHRDHGPIDQAADDARQRALHARHGHDGVGLAQQIAMGQQPVQAGHAAVARRARPDCRAPPRRARPLRPRAGRPCRPPPPRSGRRPPPRSGRTTSSSAPRGRRHGTPAASTAAATRRIAARGEHVGVVRGQALDDRHHLLRRLARAEDRLRPAAAQRAVQIELGEAEVLVGQRGEPAPARRRSSARPRCTSSSKPLQRFAIHRHRALAGPAAGWRCRTGSPPRSTVT